MVYKELFISADLDYSHYVAVIIDLETQLFYNALFEAHTMGGGTGYYPTKTGESISFERVKTLAENSEDSRAKKYLEITSENWKELID